VTGSHALQVRQLDLSPMAGLSCRMMTQRDAARVGVKAN